jgi:hypothetical protein
MRSAGPCNPVWLVCTQLGRLGSRIARQVPTALHLTATNAVYLATPRPATPFFSTRVRLLDRRLSQHVASRETFTQPESDQHKVRHDNQNREQHKNRQRRP